MGPLVVCLVICAAVTAATWIASLVTREYSWVDRIWSIVPVAYVWVFAGWSGFDARLVLMAVLVTLWGIRLTFNFARKGGYRPGGEDYRWAVLRGRMSPWQFQAVQPVLHLDLPERAHPAVLPAGVHGVRGRRARRSASWDVVLAIVFLGLLVGETIADQQQWAFHRWKAAERAAGRTPQPGFLQTGLFRAVAAPELLLRAGAVVGVLRLRRRRDGRVAALDHRGRGAAHAALHRLDGVHRVDLALEVPRLRRRTGLARRRSCRGSRGSRAPAGERTA